MNDIELELEEIENALRTIHDERYLLRRYVTALVEVVRKQQRDIESLRGIIFQSPNS